MLKNIFAAVFLSLFDSCYCISIKPLINKEKLILKREKYRLYSILRSVFRSCILYVILNYLFY